MEHIYGANNGTGGVLEERFLELEQYSEDKLKLLLQTPERRSAHPEMPYGRKIMKKWPTFLKETY